MSQKAGGRKPETHAIELANEEFLPHVAALVSEGHSVTILLKGRSMRPFLQDGRDKGVLVSPDDLRVGDAVLAWANGDHYVLHRIVALRGDDVTLLGDGNIRCEHCKRHEVLAKVRGFLRKGRTREDSTSGWKWRIYSFFWMRLYPLRHYLLYALRRLFGL